MVMFMYGHVLSGNTDHVGHVALQGINKVDEKINYPIKNLFGICTRKYFCVHEINRSNRDETVVILTINLNADSE